MQQFLYSGSICYMFWFKKVQVGKDQEKAQSEKDSHSKNRGGKTFILFTLYVRLHLFIYV